MRGFVLLGLVIPVLSLVGCESYPSIAQNAPYHTQEKIQVAQHWDAIAKDVAQQTCIALEKEDHLQGNPVFISTQSNNAFDQGFKNYITSHLLSVGIKVATTPGKAVATIKVETQIVHHNGIFYPPEYGYLPGTAMDSGTGFRVFRNAESHWPTSTELLVTTTLIKDDVVQVSMADAYYIEERESSLYEHFQDTGLKTWKVYQR